MASSIAALPATGPRMSRREFEDLAQLVRETCGIKLTQEKTTMLTSRLSKRLRLLGLASYAHYYEYVTSEAGREAELGHMIDAVTTNKTDFFREPSHFEFLTRTALPNVMSLIGGTGGGHLQLWSAACSTGEEPYTMAMVVSEFLQTRRSWRASILATDINREVLVYGTQAVYPEHLVAPIPAEYRLRYLMRGRGARQGECRIVPELRNLVTFRRLNLVGGDYGFNTQMHVVFCRNVIIYFDRDTQRELFARIYRHTAPGGYLFIGHSESLTGVSDDFERVAPTVYRRPPV